MKRSTWIDSFLQSDSIVKTARKVEAGYIEQMRILKDQITAGKKWSSVDEALEDFAKRNGFSRAEMKYLQKAAGITSPTPGKDTTPEGLMEEGIGSQGAEFMAKSKKHENEKGGPFIVRDKKVSDEIRQKHVKKNDSLDGAEDGVTQDNLGMQTPSVAEMEAFFKKYAQQFGKILDLPAPGEESMKKLVDELTPMNTDLTYNLVRHGFKFSNISGDNFTRKGEPVRVSVFQFSFLKTKLAHAINQTLREQLAQELPLEEWLKYLAEKAGPQARDLKSKLQMVQRELFSEKPSEVRTEKDRTKPESVNGILEFFPRSYQRVILSMLIDAEYRHLTSKTGREHSGRFTSGYPAGSFMLMESFDPYVKVVPQLKTKEDKIALVSGLKEAGRDAYSYEEFVALLDKINIAHQDIPVNKEYQTLKTGEREIKINNNANPSYKPVTNNLSLEDLKDPEIVEDQLKGFQNRLAAVVMQDADRIERAQVDKKPTPSLTTLAWERQPDGSYKPKDLKTLRGKDLTMGKVPHENPETGVAASVENPTAGLHPSYKGNLETFRTAPSSGGGFLGLKAPMHDKIPAAPAGKTTAPAKTKEPSSWDAFKAKSEKLKKFETLTKVLIRLGASTELWIDDKGRMYSNQQQMFDTFYDECLAEAKDDVVKMATDQLQAFVEQLPKKPSTPTMPTKETQKEEKQQEEQEALPLAASSVDRLKKVASSSQKLQKLLSKR